MSLFAINSIILSTMFIFILLNFPSVHVLDKRGLRVGVTLGIFLTCLGMWIRCLVNQSFYFAVLGQAISASGQPFMFNAFTLLSLNWFPQKERIMSTAVSAYAGVLGAGIGSFIPSLFFSSNDVTNVAVSQASCLHMCILMATCGTVVFLLTLALFRDKPEETKAPFEFHLEDYSVLESAKALLSSKNFVMQFIPHSIILSYCQALPTLLIQLIGVYGFTSAQASYLTAGFMISGILGGALTITLLTKYGYEYFRTASLTIISGTLISN